MTKSGLCLQFRSIHSAKLNALPHSPTSPHPHPLTPQYYLAEIASSEEIDVLVSKVDFELALSELVPSVSQGEMDHYREVQKKFASDTINAIKEEEEEDTEFEGGVITAPLEARLDKGKGKARE